MNPTQEIEQALNQALENLNILSTEINVESASNPQFGDYTSNIAMQLFPTLDKVRWNTPRLFAQALCDEIQKLSTFHSQFSAISVAGPGFINFTLNDSVFTDKIQELSMGKFEYSEKNAGKIAVVEYSSPNIAKPFTVAHLRSTIIGDAVANLLEEIGYTVKRDNHLGDWGTQFGKLIVAIQKLGDGNEKANIERISSSSQPVKELVKLYVEFHEKAEADDSLEEEGRNWFTKLEHGDADAKRLWQQCIDWSWVEFSKIYEELGVHFTENGGKGFGESYFEDKMGTVVEELRSSGYLQSGDEGAQLFFFPGDELSPLMILKKDGSTLYATRDLATDKFRLEKYGKDILVINEVGAEQELYFRQLYRIEELLGWYTHGQRVHVKHGLFRFKDGKMSTRKGNVIWLEDVIAEAKKRALELSKEKNEKSTDSVAIGALKWNDLKRSSHLDITFDWDEMLSMDGNSGPYIQYTAVRCKSILAKLDPSFQLSISSFQYNEQERVVAQQLLYFEDTVKRAANAYAPQLVATALYQLASAFNSFYTSNRILGETEHEMKRLFMTQATLLVLQKGLAILGISVPDEM